MNRLYPLITVIVPIYNVEKFLDKCINSILEQTYKNLEIILINDGSTDQSLKICEKYACLDKRIKIINKNNGGLSDACNTGIEISKGKYIVFVDPDDSFESDMIEYLYKLLKRNNCDLATCNYFVTVKGNKRIEFQTQKDMLFNNHNAIQQMLYSNGIETSRWAKLFKKELFKGIKFPKGKNYEDIAAVYKLFLNSTNIVSGCKVKYNYEIRENSITTTEFNESKFDLIEMTDKMGDEVLCIYPDLKKAVLRRRVYARFSTLNHMLNIKTHQKEKSEIIKFIKNNAWNVVSDLNVPFRDKVAVLLLEINYSLYKFVWNTLKKYRG